MKILVIDDHPLILDALSQLLPQLGPDRGCAARAIPPEAVAILDDDPDIALVLLDLALPGARGLDFLADLKLDYPGVPVVVLSATHDRATVMAALAAGARGFIPKTADATTLLDAVRKVLGGRHLSRRRRRADARTATACTSRPDALGLTARQADVLKLLVAGQAQQAHLPRSAALGGHGQGARQRDPQGAARAFAHAGGRRARAARHQRRDAGRTAATAPGSPARARLQRDPCAIAGSVPAGAVAASAGPRARRPGRDALRAVASHHRVDAAGRAHPVHRAVGARPRRRSWRRGSRAILVNQAWRGVLARAYRRAQPGVAEAPRWGALLVVRLHARRRAVGHRGGRDVSRRRRAPRRC